MDPSQLDKLAHALASGLRPASPLQAVQSVFKCMAIQRGLAGAPPKWFDMPALRRVPESILGRVYGHMINAPTAHYTPPELSLPLVRHTLDPFSIRRGLRVCDPAMGGGALLLDVARELSADQGRVARRRVVKELYGMDTDPDAVQVAKMTLWLFLRDATLSVEETTPNLRCGDSLFSEWPWGELDAVVANPPFAGKSQITRIYGEGYIKRLQKLHEGSHGNSDIAAHFVRLGARLIGARGVLGFVTTNTIAQGNTRQTGLQRIVADGHQIYRADTDRPWPGKAAVTVSMFHSVRGLPCPY